MWLSSALHIGLYNKQSSANKLQDDDTQSSKSLMYTKNNNGPKTVPWGTPLITSMDDDWEPLHVTYWVQLLKKMKSIPKSCDTFHSNLIYAKDNDAILYQKL